MPGTMLVERARKHVRSKGLYGKVSIDRFPGGRLPYTDQRDASLKGGNVRNLMGGPPMLLEYVHQDAMIRRFGRLRWAAL